MNIKKKTAGVALAVAAAGMLSACNSSYTKSEPTTASNTNVQCFGVNKCGGHNDCKTADNACKGHASCKGQGFVSMSAKACDDVGGTAGS